MRRRVVVSAMGILSPVGIGLEAFWSALREGRSGIGPITLFDTTDFDTHIAGEVTDFQPKKLIKQRKALKVMARDIQLAVAAGQLAMDQVDRGAVDSTRFGVSLGAGLITADLNELGPSLLASLDEQSGEFLLSRFGGEGLKNLFPLWLLKYLPNMLGCHMAIIHDAQGPNNSITTGSVASTQAIGEAVRIIERGSADCMLCGGAESRLTPLNLVRYQLLGKLSRRNSEGERASRPFDASRDGLVVGEGGGVFFAESLDQANERSAEPIAEILGYATCTGASKPPTDDMNGDGVALSIAKALADAGIDAGEVSFIVSSASGLPKEDATEWQGIQKALGDRAASIPVTSIRSMVGHLASGAGALDFAAACVVARDGILPPTLNFEAGDPGFELNVATGAAAEVGPVGLVVTLGDYSQAASIVVKRFEG